eukprot:TRINITY_DN4777_c0_g1_i1.p1 TRINITY_DN4777_c0_g1~~TRINITY_DN4777_c0_g1_i1.p1  ORF type:complete len:427 (-),score=86.83 TRINITY_DN4777_c0_g1_i1:78-1247(-)
MALKPGVFHGIWALGFVVVTLLWWYTGWISITTVLLFSLVFVPVAREIADALIAKQKLGLLPAKDQYVLVTGASRGIGAATVSSLLRQGFTVIAAVRKDQDAQSLLNAAEASGGDAKSRLECVLLDVSSQQSVDDSVSKVEAVLSKRGHQSKGLFALINNAAVAANVIPIEGFSIQEHEQVLDTNYLGVVRVTKAYLPLLLMSTKNDSYRRSRVLNVSSMAVYMPSALHGPYTAAKCAMEAWSDSLRTELEHVGIDVVIVQPGMTTTDMLHQVVPSSGTVAAASDAKRAEWKSKCTLNDYSRLLTLYELPSKMESQFVGPSVVADMMALAVSVHSRDLRTRYVGKQDVALTLLSLMPSRMQQWFLYPVLLILTKRTKPAQPQQQVKKTN